MLTNKQKRYLKKLAHHEKAIFQVGKSDVTENMVKQLNDALEKRELLKVKVLQNSSLGKEEIAQELAKGTESEIVQIIGNQIILYKQSNENQTIHLPKDNENGIR